MNIFVFRKKDIFITIISLILSFCAATQVFGDSSDYHAYLYFLKNKWVILEPFWLFVRALNEKFNCFTILYFIITYFSLKVKFNFFYKGNNRLYVVMIIFYAFTFYILHEYTQIRVSFAIGLYIWKIEYLFEKKRSKYLLWCVVCSMVHYSCFLLIPLYYFYNKKHIVYFLITPSLLLLITIFFHKMGIINFLIQRTMYTLGESNSKIGDYFIKHSGFDLDTEFNLFSLIFTGRYILYLGLLYFEYFIIYTKKIFNYYNSTCYKFLSYSLSGFYLFCNTRTLTLPIRFSELLIFSVIILLINILAKVKEKEIYCFFCLIVFVLLVNTVMSQTHMFFYH